VFGLRVGAATGGRDALDRVDDALALGAVLEADAQELFAVLLDVGDVLEVTLANEDLGQRPLELAGRYVDGRLNDGSRVADAREHVCDWIRLHLPSSVGAVSARARGPFPRYYDLSFRGLAYQLDLTTPGR